MTKTSKTSKMTKGQKWLMMTWKDLKWLEITWNHLKSLEITWNDLKWLELAFDFLVVRKMICIIFCCFLSSGCFIVLRKHFWWLIKAYQNLFSLLKEEEHFKSVSNEKITHISSIRLIVHIVETKLLMRWKAFNQSQRANMQFCF